MCKELERQGIQELTQCPVCGAPLETKDWNDTGADRFTCGCMVNYRLDGTWYIADPYGFAEGECGCCKNHMRVIKELRWKLSNIEQAVYGHDS